MPCIVFLILASLFVPSPLSADQWQEIKGDHFIVLYQPSTPKPATSDFPGDIERFAEEVRDDAETYYRRIASDIGYARSSDFWTWDNRVKLYIYPDHDAYVAQGNPQWSHGAANYEQRTITSYAFSANFLVSILPHELAHLIFRDFVGFKGEVPVWLDEGVAQWEEELKRPELKKVIKQLYDQDALLSISDMMALKLSAIKQMDGLYIRSIMTKKGTRGVLFLTGENLINTYYAQSVSLVSFLIERYGSEDFAQFCRQLRDGKSLPEALSTVYPLYIHNLDEFEEQWRKYLSEKY